MKFTITTLLLLLIGTALFAQSNYSIKGSAIDSVSNAKLENSSVSVLRAKDSILVSFTRAAADGSFAIPKLNEGEYILLVTYPEYADYVERFKLNAEKPLVNFGSVNMSLKSRLLQEVIVKGRAAAIKIKGDTTEFNAAAYNIQPNSKVEDLLKQLPGITVDKDGQITAQGEKVGKVLVDGEEFFGDDPTLVTKNIRADMVDKVQLYDKKSDQATFTGVDDGQKTKTINVKLKEDKKNGSFGKADVGIGTNGFYQGQLLFNTFRAKQKLSAYGTLSNTGKTGLGWEDNNKYGTSSGNVEMMDGGGIAIFFNGGNDDLDSFDGRYSGQGIPVTRSGGVHYDTKWNEDKEMLNGNYKIGSIGVTGSSNNDTRRFLPDGNIRTVDDQTFDNFMFRHKADGMYQVKLDSTSNLKVNFDATFKNNETNSTYNSESMRNDALQTRNSRNLSNKGDQQIFNASILYTKKLKKTGRTLSVNVAPSINQSDANGFLKSDIEYYSNGKRDSTRNIDQFKTNDIESKVLNTNITYTEPLTKTFSLVLNYGLGLNNSSADRRTFSRSLSGDYNNFVDSLSSDYKLNQLSNQAGAIFNLRQGKATVNFGTKVAAVNFKQVDLFRDNRFNRNFTNWFPQASIQYRFSQQRSFRFYYNGSTQQPSIDQIQPIRINNDPLNITLGNQDLTPSFTNRFNIGYNSYKMLSDESIWINGSYSFTTNPIVNNVVTDSAGTSTYQSINLPGKRPNNFYGSAYYDKKIKFLDINVGLNVSVNGQTYYSMVQNSQGTSDINETKSYTYSAGIRLSKYKTKKYDIWLNVNPNYNTSQASVQRSLNNNGKGLTSSGGFNLYLPLKLEVSTDATYTYRAKTATFNEDFNQVIWNATIAKTFLKQDNLRVAVSANDLLNQNTGFNRSAYSNIIAQTRNTTIRRYFMFSIIYDFNHMGGGSAKK